jgi:hypothetical protein
MLRIVLGLFVVLSWPSYAGAQPRDDHRATIAWTVSGAGAGFGVGLWAGLTAFDDAINSDRKVWTSAVVGAAIGGVAGYFLGRHFEQHQPSARDRHEGAADARMDPILERLSKSVRLRSANGCAIAAVACR